jgi:hypothetical protein
MVTHSAASGATLDIGAATSSNWTVTGGGAVNVAPYIATGSFGRGQGLPAVTLSGMSLTSTSDTNGTFVAGGSFNNFDGFWTADYRFFLPANASSITLNFANLYSDDRVVLTLNGTPIGATGIIAGHNNPTGGPDGSMEFTDGGALQPFTFSGPDGSVAGTVTAGFNVGALNVLEAIANNTNTGIYGTNQPLSAGLHDQTIVALTGSISYSIVPEPSLTAIMVLGCGIVWGGKRKLRRAEGGS